MNKFLLILMAIAILLSIGFTYKKMVIDKDFPVFIHIPCNVEDTGCFLLDEDRYYKLYRSGKNFDACLENENCNPYICDENEKYCEKIVCSEETVEEEEVCD